MLAPMNWVWIYVMEGRQEGSQENGDHFADRKKNEMAVQRDRGKKWRALGLFNCDLGLEAL